MIESCNNSTFPYDQSTDDTVFKNTPVLLAVESSFRSYTQMDVNQIFLKHSSLASSKDALTGRRCRKIVRSSTVALKLQHPSILLDAVLMRFFFFVASLGRTSCELWT